MVRPRLVVGGANGPGTHFDNDRVEVLAQKNLPCVGSCPRTSAWADRTTHPYLRMPCPQAVRGETANAWCIARHKCGDALALAQMLERVVMDDAVRTALTRHVAGRRHLVAPERERQAWGPAVGRDGQRRSAGEAA